MRWSAHGGKPTATGTGEGAATAGGGCRIGGMSSCKMRHDRGISAADGRGQSRCPGCVHPIPRITVSGVRIRWLVFPSLLTHRLRQPAVATLTYVYADSTAVVGPLATYAEPHSYDLCEHAERLTAPRGWEVVRRVDPTTPARTGDDLLRWPTPSARRPAPTPARPGRRGATGRAAAATCGSVPPSALTARGGTSSQGPHYGRRPCDLSAIVKAYDVRGVVPDQFDAEVARAVGAAFAEFVQPERRDRSRHGARHARVRSGPALARLRRRRRRSRGARRHRRRPGLDRPALLRRRLARPARRDVHRQPQPGAVQRHQAVPGRRRPGRPGDRPRRDPRAAPSATSSTGRPGAGTAASTSATCSPSTPPTCTRWSTCPASGR